LNRSRCAINTKYEIKTSSGWCDLHGVSLVKNKETVIYDGLVCSHKHKIFIGDEKVEAGELSSERSETQNLYDIIHVENQNHEYLANGISVSNCAFVDHWAEFFSSVYPTIASGKNSKIVLVSTANGLNHFYKIVSDARTGRNDFKLIEVTWRDVPGRDESGKDKQ